jgi:hypothetical protein
MGIWMALVVAAAVFPPEDGTLPRSLQSGEDGGTINGVVAARAGVWGGRPLSFEAVRTDNTQAASKQQAFFSTSALAGIELFDHVDLLATYEAEVASKLTGEMAGAYLGWREHPKEKYGEGVPDEVLIYAGCLSGHLKVHETDFGSFDRGTGFSGGIALGWDLSPHTTALFFGEYRYIKFRYDEAIISGQTSLGGSTVWFGLGLTYRF